MSARKTAAQTARREVERRQDVLAEVMRAIRDDAARSPRQWLKDAEVPGGGE